MISDTIKSGFQRAPHRSLLMATGVKREDFTKPFIGVCNSYTDIVPGHCHLNKVGEFESRLLGELKSSAPDILNSIRADREIKKET